MTTTKTDKRARLDWCRFGRQIKEMREGGESGLREVCRETGISKSAWSRVENGKPVTVPTYLAMCAWMEVHPFRHFRS